MCGIGLVVGFGERGKPGLLPALQRRGPDSHGVYTLQLECKAAVPAALEFYGTTLQLRGTRPVSQPLLDVSGNLLLFSGEVFGGVEVSPGRNDTEVVLETLKDHLSIPQALSRIRGPWAIIYWQPATRTIWFGRDAFGRRSLLVHWPSTDDSRFLLSSVAPAGPVSGQLSYWEELPCGIHSVCLNEELCEPFEIQGFWRSHNWEDPVLNKLTSWERTSGTFPENESHDSAQRVLMSLMESVKRRIVSDRTGQNSYLDGEEFPRQTPVAVLFSGGIDSMIVAAVVDQCLDPQCAIDLLNVSFQGSSAPDRQTALAGLSELRELSPCRRWRLVEIDAELGSEEERLLSLVCPGNTFMDMNIGTALWTAAGGDGLVKSASGNHIRYRSEAKVLLVGTGADEQCGGYLRYRTKFKSGGWEALAAEMRLDMQRLWKRNLGRDDRCISDRGKEARFPFLDESVIETLLGLPLQEVVDLREDIGIGDKKILRQIATQLGLSASAALPKRAIQFGTGIARQSNRKIFGSNRAANKASAGSARVNY